MGPATSTPSGGTRIEGAAVSEAGVPDGDVYDWYQRGLQLLANRDPAAAATILARASE
jgi:hypothetical protein